MWSCLAVPNPGLLGMKWLKVPLLTLNGIQGKKTKLNSKMINVKIMHGNDSEMKACISGRSERIGFYLTEGSKSSGAFFFCGNLFLRFVEVICKPAKYFAELSVYIVFIIIFFSPSFFVAFWNCLIYAKCYDIFCILNVQTEFLSIHRENEIN